MAPSSTALAIPPLTRPVPDSEPTSLVQRTAAGHADALAELFRRHGARVHEIAFRLTRSADDADDVVQEVFIGLPEALRRYEERDQFDAWLARVATRTALMGVRRGRRRNELEHQDASVAIVDGAASLDARLTVEQAMAQLSPSARELVLRRELEGQSHAEIAHALGISRNNSEVRFLRPEAAVCSDGNRQRVACDAGQGNRHAADAVAVDQR